MSPDITAVKNLLKEEKIWSAVKSHMEKYHTLQVRQFFSSLYSDGILVHFRLAI